MSSVRQVERPRIAGMHSDKPSKFSVPLPTRPPHASHMMRARDEMYAIVHRECNRCERSGMEFSLVVFDPGQSAKAARKLSRLLIDNARATDEVGWFDDKQLCAVLAYTGPAGGSAYASRIMRLSDQQGTSVSSTLYSYPSACQSSEDEPALDVSRAETQSDNAKPLDNAVPAVNSVDALLVRPMPAWKRMLDILVSACALGVSSPVMLGAALAIKLTSPGPMLFCQQRAGLGGKPFTIFKFRTMVANAEQIKATLLSQSEQDGPAFKMTNDPRVTWIGNILRKTSIDELPQLFNVLRGDMSLVGPRPLPLAESDECDVWHRRRLDVTPGLTCIWQVEGRGTVSFADWVRMDRRYIRKQSLKQDVGLMLRTVPAVLMRRGAK